MTERLIVERNLEMKTRDGVVLRADVVRPDIKAKVPALVARTPYDKTGTLADRPGFLPPFVAAAAGFAVVVQDIRGRFASDGDWDFVGLRDTESADGFDCIEWVASEPWCDGNVGMFGGSYLAENQIAAALSTPPGLKAIAPALTGMGADRMRSQRGHLESIMIAYLSFLASAELERRMAAGESVDPNDLARVMRAFERPWDEAGTLPLKDLLSFQTPGMPSYAELETLISSATPREGRGEDKIPVPALWTSGWFDSAVGGEGYREMRNHAPVPAAREGTHLVLGPWTHNYHSNHVGELGLGGFADPVTGGVRTLHLNFYSRYLRGDDVQIPRVKYFLLGANTWMEAEDWPVPGTEPTRMYLHSRGSANSASGDGSLSFDAPAASEHPDVYTYNPQDPVPSWGFRVMYTGGKTLAGPFDQRRVESRSDVLCYTSEPMTEPLEVVGDVELHVHVASTAPDTDFVAKLCDVGPDGVSVNLADGFVRARYREHWDRPSFLTPGEPVQITVLLGPTGNVFLPGHRIRVQLTSSAFPHYARNLNTTEAPEIQATPVVAEQTVFHDAQRPSHVALPIRNSRD